MRKLALVTGGGRGIGAAVCAIFARAGYDIWLNYRNVHASAERVAEEVLSVGCECVLCPSMSPILPRARMRWTAVSGKNALCAC